MLVAFERLQANRAQRIAADRAAWLEAVEYLAKLADDAEPKKTDLAKIECLLASLGRHHDRLREAVELRRQQFALEAKIAKRPDVEAEIKQALENLESLADSEQDTKTKRADEHQRLRQEQDALRSQSNRCSSSAEREGVLAELVQRGEALRQNAEDREADRVFYENTKAGHRSRLGGLRNTLQELTEAARELAALKAKEQSLAPS